MECTSTESDIAVELYGYIYRVTYPSTLFFFPKQRHPQHLQQQRMMQQRRTATIRIGSVKSRWSWPPQELERKSKVVGAV